MIQVSDALKNEIMAGTASLPEAATITLVDGSVIQLDGTNLTTSNNSLVDGAASNDFPIGVAIEKQIQLEFINDYAAYRDVDFLGASVVLFIDAAERIEKGTYTVTAVSYGDYITLTALDSMHRADRDYGSALSYPATIASMLAEICSTCGIELGSSDFAHSDYTVQEAPKGTCRQVIGYIAMIAGGNARVDNENKLQIVPCNLAADKDKLELFKTLTVDGSDVLITGVKTIDGAFEAGTEEYMLAVDNPLIAGHEVECLGWIYAAVGGGTFRPFEGIIPENPLVEFMDPVTIRDWRGNTYMTMITDVEYTFCGATAVKNTAPGMSRSAFKTAAGGVSSTRTYYSVSDAPTTAPETGWSTSAPDWVEGQYIWQKTITTYNGGITTVDGPVCVTGNTGEVGVSVTGNYRYYLLCSATLEKPEKPATNPPGGSWDDTEPAYTGGSTESLYIVDLTVFSDDTFQYSDVSLSSSYEAAKAAYNKAEATQEELDTLTTTENEKTVIDGTKIKTGSVTAGRITVKDVDGNTVFDADANGKMVQIGGFMVNADELTGEKINISGSEIVLLGPDSEVFEQSAHFTDANILWFANDGSGFGARGSIGMAEGFPTLHPDPDGYLHMTSLLRGKGIRFGYDGGTVEKWFDMDYAGLEAYKPIYLYNEDESSYVPVNYDYAKAWYTLVKQETGEPQADASPQAESMRALASSAMYPAEVTNAVTRETLDGVTWDGFNVYTVGKMVWVRGMIRLTDDGVFSSWTTVATGLPAPVKTVFDVSASRAASTYYRPLDIQVTTSGGLMIRYGAANGGWMYMFNLAYAAK